MIIRMYDNFPMYPDAAPQLGRFFQVLRDRLHRPGPREPVTIEAIDKLVA